jgi:diguanylate cyclase (GGDEF)-like protein
MCSTIAACQDFGGGVPDARMETSVVRDSLKRRSVTYPLAGALLAAGAPLGLMFMRRFAGDHVGVRVDVRRDIATYAYLTASTTLVFVLLGRALGRNADDLARLSATDGLTGLLNAQAFHTRLQEEVERSKRSGAPMTLLLLDLDHLKALNDRYGHSMGDRALAKIARAIQQEMRSIDVGGRLGGDEFGLLAVGTDRAAALTVSDRLQKTIAGHMDEELGFPVTASIGVVTFDPPHAPPVDSGNLARAADAALYRAKRGGRNRVAVGRLERQVR